MPIDVQVPGSPDGVRALADWLDAIQSPLSYVDDAFTRLTYDSTSYWTGDAQIAWSRAASDLHSRIADVPWFLLDLRDELRSYALVLQNAQADAASLLEQAAALGLPTSGTVVSEPLPPAHYYATASVPQDQVDREDVAHHSLTITYNDLCRQMGQLVGSIDEWIGQHLLPLIDRAQDAQRMEGVLDGLVAEAVHVGVDWGTDAAENAVEGNLDFWLALQNGMQADADAQLLAMASGNPMFRSAAATADQAAMNAGITAIAEKVDDLTTVSRLLKAGGVLTEIVGVAIDLDNGGSISADGAAWVGGGLASGLVAATVTGPPGWVAAASVGAGIAGAEAGRFVWEAAVPRTTREAIDDFFTGYRPYLADGGPVQAEPLPPQPGTYPWEPSTPQYTPGS